LILMLKPVISIGNAQAFWGDDPRAPETLVKQRPDLDFLTLDYLSEVSLSIMAIQREKNPGAGFAGDFPGVVASLVPLWHAGSEVRVITNAGGLNPRGCAEACAEVLKAAGHRGVKIGIVSGDDVLAKLLAVGSAALYANLETGESVELVRGRLVTANAYLGARLPALALIEGADIVITGRVADPSLTVAACRARFGWREDDYDRLAGATVAGHLIECGTQVTGGISTYWMELEERASIGFPVVEIAEDGCFVVTKPETTGGRVSEETVKEQLVYEISDPGCYLSPDVTVSMLNLQLEAQERDRVEIRGARGSPPPSTLKVSGTYRDGFRAEATLMIVGPNAPERARSCGQVILERMRRAGLAPARSNLEALGGGDAVPGVLAPRDDLFECVLRVTVADERRDCLEYFSRQVASLVTSGPSGVTGYTSGRPTIRPVFGYWPCLIEANEVPGKLEMLEV
jgi:hypothetical protein